MGLIGFGQSPSYSFSFGTMRLDPLFSCLRVAVGALAGVVVSSHSWSAIKFAAFALVAQQKAERCR